MVATNVGGIPTTITDRLDGILVPPKDSTALAQAIDRIVADGELRRALIRAGFKRVRSMTIDRFVATVLGVLHTWAEGAMFTLNFVIYPFFSGPRRLLHVRPAGRSRCVTPHVKGCTRDTPSSRFLPYPRTVQHCLRRRFSRRAGY